MTPNGGWQSTKIGAGPIPIETREGWLMIYHGVLTSCNGFVYSFGAALLDLDEPWKVLYRTRAVHPESARRLRVRRRRAERRVPVRGAHRRAHRTHRDLLRLRRHRHGPCVLPGG